MRAIDGVRRSGKAVGPHRPIRDAAMIMNQSGVGSLAVIDDGRLVGIVTDRDLVRRGLAQDLAPTTPVEKVMSTPVVTIGAEADLHSAFKLFRTHAVRRLAVVDFDNFVGMITVDDILVGPGGRPLRPGQARRSRSLHASGLGRPVPTRVRR